MNINLKPFLASTVFVSTVFVLAAFDASANPRALRFVPVTPLTFSSGVRLCPPNKTALSNRCFNVVDDRNHSLSKHEVGKKTQSAYLNQVLAAEKHAESYRASASQKRLMAKNLQETQVAAGISTVVSQLLTQPLRSQASNDDYCAIVDSPTARMITVALVDAVESHNAVVLSQKRAELGDWYRAPRQLISVVERKQAVHQRFCR